MVESGMTVMCGIDNKKGLKRDDSNDAVFAILNDFFYERERTDIGN